MATRDWMRCYAIIGASLLVPALGACFPDAPDERLKVVVTVPPLAGLVDRVAPGLTDVMIMIPAGANPVTYEPSLSRVRAAADAELFVSVGHPAFVWEQAWLAGLLRRGDAVVLSSADGCAVLVDDPHTWLSLDCARGVAERIAAAVQQARPESADSIAIALSSLLEEMDDIRAAADRALGPHRGGSFIVLHPAWGYLAGEYDIEQIAILDHGSGDAGPAELAGIVSRARALGHSNVVVQPQFSAEPAALVARELAGDTVMLDPLGRDWASSLREAVHVLSREVRP